MAKSTLSPEERIAKRREYRRRDYEKHKDAILERNRQWAKANPEKANAISRRYKQRNPEKCAAAVHRHYEQNKEKILAYQRQWVKDNREKARAMQRDWCERNREKVRARLKRWVENNPEAYRAALQRYKDKDPKAYAARRSAIQQIREAYKLQQMPHWVILEDLFSVYENRPPDTHVDHIVPLRGITFDGYRVSGLHVPWNLQYLAPIKNSRKKNKMRLEDHTAIGAPVET